MELDSLVSRLVWMVFFFAAGPVDAATRTVKSGGGGDYATISSCAAAAAPGDTCLVFAGTFTENVTFPQSGVAGSPITLAVNPGDCVTVNGGFDLGTSSYLTIGTPSASACAKSGQTFSGFEVTGGLFTWTRIDHVAIQDNYIHDMSDICLKGPGTNSSGASSYVYVRDNIISVCGTLGDNVAGGMQVEGDHWLIEGNSISHVEDGIYLYGAFMVLRNNTFGPLAASDYGSQHPDAVESSCTLGADFPLQHMLYERNHVIDWGQSNAHNFLMRDTQNCGQISNVVRFSTAVNVGTYWFANDTDSLSELIYNNSVDNTQVGMSPKDMSDLTFVQGDTGENVINNVFANMTRPDTADWCYWQDGTSVAGFVGGNNLCFLDGYTGSWTAPASGYATTDLFNQDPKFVDPANGDLHIQPGSAAVGAGGPLTHAMGAGGGSTALSVVNAGFFSDGYGLEGVQGDWIRIGFTATVQICSVNYASNLLTLCQPQSWSDAAPVFLYALSDGTVVLGGAAPDIGAYPLSSVGRVDAGGQTGGGPNPDAGATGGTGDAGTVVAGGGGSDGGPVAGETGTPGGSAGPPGTSARMASGGCGCAAGNNQSGVGTLAWLVLAALQLTRCGSGACANRCSRRAGRRACR